MPAGHISDRIRSWGSPFRALLLPHSRAPSPAPLPSCRWLPQPTPQPTLVARACAPRQEANSGASMRALAFRALLRTRVRHRGQRFRSAAARSSLGLRPSRVLPLAGIARSSPGLPSCGSRRRKRQPRPLQGLPYQRARLVSRRRLPTLLGFMAS